MFMKRFQDPYGFPVILILKHAKKFKRWRSPETNFNKNKVAGYRLIIEFVIKIIYSQCKKKENTGQWN